MRYSGLLIFLLFMFPASEVFAQDVDLYLTDHYLAGKSVVKLARDFDDPYMWILAQNNGIFRINTATKQLDDYSAQFQSFNGYQIIDIAGIDANWVVFLIRNADSTVLVSNNNGNITYPLRNNFYQVQGTILNIGTSSIYTEEAYLVDGRPAVLISTDQGFYRLSLLSGLLNYNSSGRSQLYAATYRTQLYRDRDEVDTSGTNLIPVMATTPPIYYYPGMLRKGTVFGDTINTAFFTINQVFNSPYYFTPDAFWGNDSGLFQAKLRNATPFLSSYRHYLNGIRVNKICDIFGLTSFGNQVAKENLLVGTDNGLYYSNSVLHTGIDTALDNLTLYHYNKLGNIQISFIEVNNNGVSTPPPFCENGIWIACNDGIYLIKPDYAAHTNSGQIVNAVHFKNDADVSKTMVQICQGDTTHAQLNTDVTTNSIQWFKDGIEIINQNGNTLPMSATGDYYAILFDPCAGVHLETNHLKVQVIAAPVFSFNYPAKLQYCDSTSTTLKTDQNPIYHYRWYTDGVLNGDTTFKYKVTQSGKYKVELSACTNSWVPSKEIEVDLVNLPVSIVTSDKTQYCEGENASLTVDAAVDAGYTINWYKDGSVIATEQNKKTIQVSMGGNYSVILASTIAICNKASNERQVVFIPAPVFTFNYPDRLAYCEGTPITLTANGSNIFQYRWYKDGQLTGDVTAGLNITQSGKYKVEVSACAGSWVPSKAVQVDLISIPAPVIKTDKPSYCIGDNATMSIAIPNSASYTINWYKDNVQLGSFQNHTSLITNIAGNYTVVVTSNEVNTDGTICTQTSAAQIITFNPPPTVSIQKIVRTTLCDGQTVDLKVTYDGGTVKWSTGETNDQVSVNKSGSYRATVTSASNCVTDKSIDVLFFPNPLLNLPNTVVCVPSHKTATLTAPSGMASYFWNGVPGNVTYVVDHPQTVTLMVTDVNGCQATQDIQITDECPNINIPNAFTPNGDGINDTWNIIGLAYDPSVIVKIFTRNGQQVFESRGYAKPWDGVYKGKLLSSGVYYYIINAKNGNQTYSGSVTVIY